jgi:hypothetical protein
MTSKAEALVVAFARGLMRELLADEKPVKAPAKAAAPRRSRNVKPKAQEEDPNPQPRFDFDESNDVCLHGDLYIPKAACPIHGPAAQNGVTDAELDDITSEGSSNLISRAERLRERREKQAANERDFAEEVPMRGMGPPPE